MNLSSKIYIPGHTGMVGSAILRCLQEKGYTKFLLRTIEELDLMRQADVEDFFKQERPEYVIDAAAKVGGIEANNTYRAQFIYENLTIQNNLIHSSYKYGIKKLLFLGSSCIYPRLAPQPLKEEYLLTGELEPTNEPYAIAKIAGIKMCESYNRQYGCNFFSVMPTNLFGPNDNYNLETSHVLPALLRKIHLARCLEINDWKAIRHDLDKRPIEGITGSASEEEIIGMLDKYGIELNAEMQECRNAGMKNSAESQSNHFTISPFHQFTRSPVTVTLWGTGNVYREFMHVDDMASACVKILEDYDVSGFRFQVSGSEVDDSHLTSHDSPPSFLNIGTGVDSTIRELAELIRSIVGFQGKIEWDATKPDGTPKKLLDVSRLKETGFVPAYTLEEGIRRVYEGYKG